MEKYPILIKDSWTNQEMGPKIKTNNSGMIISKDLTIVMVDTIPVMILVSLQEWQLMKTWEQVILRTKLKDTEDATTRDFILDVH